MRHVRTRRARPLVVAALFALLVSLLAAPRAFAADPLGPTNRDYDQIHVIVRVTPRIDASAVDGETTVRFASMVDSLKVLRLHCQETAVMSVKDGEGTPLEFSLAENVLSVTLSKP